MGEYIGIIIFWGFVAIVVIVIKIQSNNRKGTDAKFEAKGFKSSAKYISDNGKAGLAVDEKRKLLCFINNGISSEVAYADIISSEIIEDSETVTKTSRTSQVGGAIVGTALLGGIGTIVGGLSGKQTSKEKIKKISLHIIVNNVSAPSYTINFMDFEATRGGFIYNAAIAKARHWHGVISSVIRQADTTAKEEQAKTMSNSDSTSTADELIKLADLLDKGILTQAEFATQKEKILS